MSANNHNNLAREFASIASQLVQVLSCVVDPFFEHSMHAACIYRRRRTALRMCSGGTWCTAFDRYCKHSKQVRLHSCQPPAAMRTLYWRLLLLLLPLHLYCRKQRHSPTQTLRPTCTAAKTGGLSAPIWSSSSYASRRLACMSDCSLCIAPSSTATSQPAQQHYAAQHDAITYIASNMAYSSFVRA
jgi:hypothetical protein